MNKYKQGSGGVIWVVLALGFAVLSAMLGYRLYQTSDAAAVATVNGEKITRVQVYDRMVKQGGTEAIGRMIDEILVKQESNRLNVTVTDSEINAEIDKIKQRIGGDAQFNAALAQYNVTLEQIKDDTQHNLRIRKMIMKDLTIADDDLKAHFEENRETYDQKEQIKARHILVHTEEEAKALKAELDSGADFGQLAAAHSEDTGSKVMGGDLGFFERGAMVPEFDQVAFTMETGRISEPVKSSFGYHIIQVTDKKEARQVTFEEVKDQVSESYTSAKVQELYGPFMEALKAKANITNTLVADS